MRWAVLVLSCGIVQATAQDATYRNVDAVSGRPLRLAVVTNVKRDCTPGPLPEVRLTTPPKSGAVIIRRGKARLSEKARCPHMEAAVQLIVYQAKQGFVGADEVSFSVRTSEGRVQSHTIRISVRQGARPVTPSKPIDL